jgi:hypothetical protein
MLILFFKENCLADFFYECRMSWFNKISFSFSLCKKKTWVSTSQQRQPSTVDAKFDTCGLIELTPYRTVHPTSPQ